MRLRRPVELTVAVALVAGLTTTSRQADASICYAHPFGHVKINDPFGSPRSYGRHRGVDYGAGYGTPIGAIAEGTVVVNTWSGCLGNVVVVQHPDGMFSGYGHMHGKSPLPVGTSVSKGSHVGQLGNTGTCTTGPHLHMTLGYAAGSWSSGATIDPIPFINERLSCNKPPSGALDAANAEGITGWAFDPEAGKAAIAVHLYIGGPAGNADAVKFPVQASLARPDLCAPLGSCDHGFSLRAPRGFFDGAAHPVYAYGIDSGGGSNTLLPGSPRQFQAAPPAIPPGTILRRVEGQASFDAWRFVPLYDVAPMPGDGAKFQGESYPKGPAMPSSPEVVRSDDGSETVWVIDGGLRRRAAAKPWRFENVKELAAPVLMQIPQGHDFPSEPLLVGDVGPTHYVLDTPRPVPGEDAEDDGDPRDGEGNVPAPAMPPVMGDGSGTGAGASGAASGSGSSDGRGSAVVAATGENADEDAGGCAVAPTRASKRQSLGDLFGLGALAGALWARRRSARRPCAS